MKQVLISMVAIGCLGLCANTTSAQVKAYKAPSIVNSTSVAYALPRTTLKVTVVAEKESIRKGPYARFAQKFLGVMAPLADKDLYTIVDASITYGQEADPAEVYVLDNPEKSPVQIYDQTEEGFVASTLVGGPKMPRSFAPAGKALRGGTNVLSYVESDTSFVKISIDRRDVIEKSPESMALEAATAIFSLRKRRMELITGEAGENVFGEGLKTALKEINRMEQEYLSLFLGKQFRTREIRTYDVVPERDKMSAVVCRFSDVTGLLSPSDLSGRPVLVEMTPEKKVQNTPLARKNTKDTRTTVYYRIADVVNCRVMDEKNELTQSRIPIYQFGLTVEVPANSLK